MNQVESRIREMGYEIPPFTKPQASYVPAVRSGDMIFISGQGATRCGKPVYTGHVGAEVTLEQALECARVCALNALSVLKNELGDLDRVKRVVKVLGFVNSAPGFDRQPVVINGFSDFMVAAFGDRGAHARSAVACNELPYGTPVEVELIVEVE